MSYVLFDLLVLAVPCLLLLRGTTGRAVALRPAGVLALLAVVWTAPWDDHLVRTGVWSYDPAAVVARLGAVPVEEYAFVGLQVLLVAAWGLRSGRLTPVDTAPRAGSRWRGALGWGLVCLTGLALAAAGGHVRYLGLLTAWAAPVLALQHAVGGDLLAASRRGRLQVAAPVALWLCAADRIAIATGTWSISPRSSTGLAVLGLPVEELLFFALTCLLVTDGLLLAASPQVLGRVLRLRPAARAARVPAGWPALPTAVALSAPRADGP